MSENINELEEFYEIANEISNTLLEIKTIVESLSFSNVTKEMLSFKDIATEIKFILDTMKSFQILTNFTFAEKAKDRILSALNNFTSKETVLELTANMRTNGLEKFKETKRILSMPSTWNHYVKMNRENNSKRFNDLIQPGVIENKIKVSGTEKIAKVSKALQNLKTGSKNVFSAMGTGIMGVIPAFQMLTASASQFLMAMLTNPVTWLILGIALAVMVVINAFKMLSTSSDEDVKSLMDGLKAVGDFIMNIGKIIFNVFVAVVTVVITLIAKIVAFVREPTFVLFL